MCSLFEELYWQEETASHKNVDKIIFGSLLRYTIYHTGSLIYYFDSLLSWERWMMHTHVSVGNKNKMTKDHDTRK